MSKNNSPNSKQGSTQNSIGAVGQINAPRANTGGTATQESSRGLGGPANFVEAKGGGQSAATTAANMGATRDQIAAAAYLRWQKYGGDALSNWIAAEKELSAASAKR